MFDKGSRYKDQGTRYKVQGTRARREILDEN
jgi:hypothetical protein